MGKINIIEYDASGNVVTTVNNVDDPFNSYVTPNIYNEDGTLSGNRTVNLAKNYLKFQGDQNDVTINGDGSISINDTTQNSIDLIEDYGFDDNAAWSINNTYPGTNTGTVTAGELQLLADNSAGYNEWRITSTQTYPTEAKIMELDWELEMSQVDGSSPQQIDIYLGDKSNTFYLLQANVTDSGMYSGTITLTEQSMVSASPILRVYMSSVQPASNKVFITKFRLMLRQPAIKVKNFEADSVVAAEKISIAPTTNILSTSTSEFGRLFVKSSDKQLYYRPAQSTTDYNIGVGGVHGANCVEFEYEGTSSSAPSNGKFRSPGTSSLASVSGFLIDNENIDNVSISAWLDIIDTNLTASRPGYIQISEKGNSAVTALYSIFSYFDSTTYKDISLLYVWGSGTLTVGKNYLISYLFDGADGGGGGGGITKNESIALSIALG